MGKGHPGRLESRPQARKPAPHECRPTPKVIAPQQRSQRPLKPTTGKTAGVARKTACSTQRPAWQAWRLAPLCGGGFSRAWKCTQVDENGRTGWAAPTWRGIGLSRGRWVKGAQAGWKAGRRLESLPHIRCLPKNRSLTHKEGARHQNACTIVGVGMSSQANHRQDCRCGKQDCLLHANIRCGTQDCVLHGEAGMASLAAGST